ncbi:MAG: glycosyltransferase [Phycisphaerales bacterium]|nr:glycosyltransferase [Phycisphaerales bacterium]
MTTPRICLNMIVKDETHIVTELLDSVVEHVHAWVIVDTGSTDGTQDLIRGYFAKRGIPGVLHERPWVDFGTNRTEALRLARGKADYILVMDADDVLVGRPNFRGLTKDAYELAVGADTRYYRLQLFKNELPWKYVGVLHEYPDCDYPFSRGRIDGDYYVDSRRLGARSKDPEKYVKDARILERALVSEPENSRYQFYLARSWFDAKEHERAIAASERRIQMGGWSEEVFYSQYMIGKSMRELGRRAEMFERLLLTFERFPHRAEPLHVLAHDCMQSRNYRLGYHFGVLGLQIPMPETGLFVEPAVYSWRLLDIVSVCASYIGRGGEGAEICKRLLEIAPENQRERIRANLAFCLGPASREVGAAT